MKRKLYAINYLDDTFFWSDQRVQWPTGDIYYGKAFYTPDNMSKLDEREKELPFDVHIELLKGFRRLL